MHKAVVILGGNTGKVQAAFEACIQHLQEKGYKIEKVSAIYSSKSWGYESEHIFYNQVLVVLTNHNPQQVLKHLLETETLLGRSRHESPDYHDRNIDIDLLFYDEEIIHEKNLEVPHPRLHLRNFCLVPLNEVIPAYRHPVLQKTVAELLAATPDPSLITRL